MGKEVVFLKHNTNLLLVCLNSFWGYHCVIHLYGSLLWKLDACQLTQQGRFAAAGSAHNTNCLFILD